MTWIEVSKASAPGASLQSGAASLPVPLEAEVFARLPAELAVVVRAFRERYGAR